jgi:hypothetical protein
MSNPKTRPEPTDPDAFVAALEARRRGEADRLIAMMARVTGAPPVIWTGGMVGFGSYAYTYASGRSGRWLITGFRPAKARLSVYVTNGFAPYAEALARLGPHKHSVSCLYLSALDRIDMGVLEEIVTDSVARMRAMYPD